MHLLDSLTSQRLKLNGTKVSEQQTKNLIEEAMPTKSPQTKTSNLGNGRGGRPRAGQSPPGQTRQVHASLPDQERQLIQKIALSLGVPESEIIRRAIFEYLSKHAGS